MSKRRATVMLIDDSKADQTMIKRALEDGAIAVDLLIANNGEEALAILNERNHNDAQPHLILLDINMPVMGGIETLNFIKADDNLKHIPVVMLTTSKRDQDVIESYKFGVNAYLTKPVGHLDFINVIKQLETFWFELVVLPKQPREQYE